MKYKIEISEDFKSLSLIYLASDIYTDVSTVLDGIGLENEKPFRWEKYNSPGHYSYITTTITADQFAVIDEIKYIWEKMLYGDKVRESLRDIFAQLSLANNASSPEKNNRLQTEVNQLHVQVEQMQTQINQLTKNIVGLQNQIKSKEENANVKSSNTVPMTMFQPK